MGQKSSAIIAAAVVLIVVAVGATLVVQRMRSVVDEQRQAAVAAAAEQMTTRAETPRAGNLRIGDQMPDFRLHDAEGNEVDFSSFLDGGDFLVVNFHHPGCPCAENCGRLISRMQQDGYDQDVRIIGVMAHDTRDEYILRDLEQQRDDGLVTFPVYFDHDREVKEMLGATRTPEVWVLDREGRIAYWGAPESTLFPGSDGHRFLLREAIDALRLGEQPEVLSYEPIGCQIPAEG